MRDGNFGRSEPCGGGVSELKLDFGPGYRVYYAKKQDGTFVLLLCVGDKSSQANDIKTAKAYWKEFKERK